MKKILLVLVSVIALSVGIYSVVEASVLTTTVESSETFKDIEYQVEHNYISREGWGHTYTITIQNQSDKRIFVQFTAKGCNGENANCNINAYAKEVLLISTGDIAAEGWAIEQHQYN